MADELRRIFVIHTTLRNPRRDAQSNARFELIASTSGTDFTADFPDLPHDERQQGLTDSYEFNVRNRGVNEDTELTIRMKAGHNDAWLPSSIWAIGETATTPTRYVVLAANPEWPDNLVFDRGSDAAGPPSHRIN